MAAKATAKPPKAKQKATKAPRAKSARSQFTPVQFAAYQKARRSAVQKAQFRVRVQQLQQRRLQGAATANRKLNLKYQQAVRARIKARATAATYRQTVSGQQSKALRLQAARRLFQAQSVATQKQFAYLGERIHKKTTVLQTLTTKQAESRLASFKTRVRRNALRKQKLRPVARAKAGRPRKRVSNPFAAVGNAAGMQAAKSVRNAASSPKKVAAKPKPRKAAARRETAGYTEWVTAGNDQRTENCVAVAVANHLFLHTGYRMTDDEVMRLHRDSDGMIKGTLAAATKIYPGKYEPLDYCPDGAIVAYGDHAAVLMPGCRMISWGEIMAAPGEIEEAWRVEWTTWLP